MKKNKINNECIVIKYIKHFNHIRFSIRIQCIVDIYIVICKNEIQIKR